MSEQIRVASASQNPVEKGVVEIIEPNVALVQATADLLAARAALYTQQPGHPLVAQVDAALESLLNPLYAVAFPHDAEKRCPYRSPIDARQCLFYASPHAEHLVPASDEDDDLPLRHHPDFRPSYTTPRSGGDQ